MSASLLDAYWQLPVVSRTMATAAFVCSVGVQCWILPSSLFGFHYSFLLKFPPRIWTLPLSFLLTGPEFDILTDTYFLYKYLSDLETSPRMPRREDLIWYICCVGIFTVIFTDLLWRNVFTNWGPHYIFLKGLLTATVYTATQDMRGQKASFWFFTIPAQVMPWCLVLMSCLSSRSIPFVTVQLGGILAAHLWDFLTRIWPEFGGGRNLLPTPAFMSRLVSTPSPLQRPFGTAFRPSQATATSTGVSTGGPLPQSWRTRGAGHRLGGD